MYEKGTKIQTENTKYIFLHIFAKIPKSKHTNNHFLRKQYTNDHIRSLLSPKSQHFNGEVLKVKR